MTNQTTRRNIIAASPLRLQPHPRRIPVREFDASGFQRGPDGIKGPRIGPRFFTV